MKIGIEAQRLYRKKKHGMDIVALELIKNLQEIDKENEYVIFVKPDEDDICISEKENFKIVPVKKSPFPIWEQFLLPRHAKKEKCDILHCTSNTAPIWSKIKSVLTLHDIIYLEKLSILQKSGSWYQKLGNMYRRFIVPKAVRKASKIITVSDFERQKITNHFGINGSTLFSVHNGVSSHFKPQQNENELKRIKKKYKLPDNYLFFIGNTDPKKNTRNVLKAFSIFHKTDNNQIFLVMPDYEEQNLMKILKDIGDPELRKYIRLTGYIDNKELPVIYGLSELFLYPSKRESFGIPIIEAMSCGTPVITSNVSSMPEVAGDAAIKINPLSSIEIANSIKQIISNNELKETLIRKGYKRAEQFTWKEMAKKVLNIYIQVEN